MQWIGFRLDAKKVLKKIGGKRPGKRCKGGWIAAEKQCSTHKSKDGKLTDEGRDSAKELAARIRDRKGMQDPRHSKIGRMSLSEFTADIKGVPTEKQLMPIAKKVHGEQRSELDRRRAKMGLRTQTQKELTGLDDRIEKTQKQSATRKGQATRSRNKQISPQDLSAGDRKQAVQYAQQGAERAKNEGRSTDKKAWNAVAKAARMADLKSAQRQLNTTQTSLFGIEEVTDMPLFKQRKDSIDSFRFRVDRAIGGGKAKKRNAGRKRRALRSLSSAGLPAFR